MESVRPAKLPVQKGPEARLHSDTLSFAHLEPGGSHREDAQAASLVPISVWLVTVPSNATRPPGRVQLKGPLLCPLGPGSTLSVPSFNKCGTENDFHGGRKESREDWEGQAVEGHQGRPIPWSALQMGGASKGQDDWHPVVREKAVRSVTMAFLEPPAGHELYR